MTNILYVNEDKIKEEIVKIRQQWKELRAIKVLEQKKTYEIIQDLINSGVNIKDAMDEVGMGYAMFYKLRKLYGRNTTN